jgi:hypothetical protein
VRLGLYPDSEPFTDPDPNESACLTSRKTIALEAIRRWCEYLDEVEAEMEDALTVPIYGAPSPVPKSDAFPGKIKEANIAATGNAYKDSPTVKRLREFIQPDDICRVLDIFQ